MTKKFFFFFFIFPSIFSFIVVKVEDYLNATRSIKYSSAEYKEIISAVKSIMKKYYAFYDIAKNPPQPSFDPNYHNRVDLESELNSIDTSENQNYYDLYRGILTAISRTRDYHTTFTSYMPLLSDFLFIYPITIYTKVVNSEAKIFGKENLKGEFFRNGTEVFKVIERNKNVPIKLINGKSPFEYIQNFGGEFNSLHNPHSTYTLRSLLVNGVQIKVMPLDKEELTNFKVEYESGEFFETDSLIFSLKEYDKNNYRFFNDPEIEAKFLEYITEQINNEIKSNNNNNNNLLFEKKIPKTLFQHLSEFEEKFGVVNNIFSKKIEKKKKNSIVWDIEYKEENEIKFQCRVDKENNFNVYKVPTFSANNMLEYQYAISNCSSLFDNNDFPIIIILTRNGGGYVLLAQILTEIVQPHISTRFWGTVRDTENISEMYSDIFGSLSRTDNCKEIDFAYFDSQKKKQKFGNIESTVYGPFLLEGSTKESIDITKKKIKNKRIPTKVILFTDSYSFSAGSIFTKNLQNLGGAIVLGYNGNPEKSKEIFDSSQSPTAIEGESFFKKYAKKEYEIINKYKLNIEQLGFIPSYINSSINIPQEYSTLMVDERTDIYSDYSDDIYDQFMLEAKKYLKKYNEDKKCSGVNPRLTLYNTTCDKDNITYGGYTCKNGSFDFSSCAVSHCALGYYLDLDDLTCKEDPCSPFAPWKPEKKKSYAIYIILLVFVVVLVVVGVFCFARKRKEGGGLENLL